MPTLRLVANVEDVLDGLRKGKHSDPRRHKKLLKALAQLEQDPRHPGLVSHRFASLDSVFGERIYESYAENHVASAWRIWWFYGPEDDEVTVVDIGPHP